VVLLKIMPLSQYALPYLFQSVLRAMKTLNNWTDLETMEHFASDNLTQKEHHEIHLQLIGHYKSPKLIPGLADIIGMFYASISVVLSFVLSKCTYHYDTLGCLDLSLENIKCF
jgi:hypothetical protein